MKTASYESLLNTMFKGQDPAMLELDDVASIWAVDSDFSGPLAQCSHASIDPEYKAKEHQIAAAALLAHCFNQFPEAITLLELAANQASILKSRETDMSERKRFDLDEKLFREFLAKAKSVSTP